MKYEDIVTYISDIPKFTKKNNPDHTKRFLELLGSPQENRKILHVAGTNGKGSVCVYLEAMLRAEGQTTGLFISPHLVKMNERIIVNGQQISDEQFIDAFEDTMDAVRRLETEGFSHPTFFEFLFGMAMRTFAKADVSCIVLETGLGGRLDATNVCEHPVLTLIASIGLDHTEYLGTTLEQIAWEKAGIIKPGVPCLYSEGEKESNQVIEKRAESLQSPCRKIAKSAFEILEIKDKHIAFSCVSDYYEDTIWTLDNIGVYQPANAMLALEGMRCLAGEQVDTGRLHVWRDALAAVHWEGRMEEILPRFYVDGAHNVNAVRGFADSVPDGGAQSVILFSAVQDKNYEEMISCLCENVQADEYIVTTIADKRRTKAQELGDVFCRYTDKPVSVKEALPEAFHYARKIQGERTVYCLGSLYLTGMLKALVEESQEDSYA
ncbi:bifunctional folylpolyglutamate synthase/dihydrofolate synthase [Hespellia stercorisuis]|uniref:tetrahydrofolate synthase n=1 Tax=Hespellia stercorisuis DSM 15480 TaxID=1121950 RepID=A0A1M6NHU4_9FIRM|nr:tetrahydrofolate synthase [Hespellia stercorisuis]SHJ95311.1 dihydrofolate synthase / folylpolyglutamate synthase [Hespellia stercorisuis DSM 15480]